MLLSESIRPVLVMALTVMKIENHVGLCGGLGCSSSTARYAVAAGDDM